MTDLTTLTRYRERGSHERRDLDALLDEVLVGTLSTVVDGEPWSVPLLFARDGDRVLLHGSTGAGMLRFVTDGAPVALCVHTLDALVVAQSAFDSSANYRSAVLRGRLEAVAADERDAALRVLSDRIVPGRTREVRENTTRELAATTVLALPITEGGWTYKARSGPSGLPDEGPVEGVWAGIVPLHTVASQPERDDWVGEVPVPASVTELVRRFS